MVYDPLAHWLWAPGGWLANLGALDFAGGAVVHISSGLSALVVAIVIGGRLGYPREKAMPHNLTMTLLGAGLLWFGWFGFNAGSALAADGIAASALMATNATGGVTWLVVDSIRLKKGSSLGFASGFVAGLATITPAAGFVGPMSALLIGLAAGLVCYAGVLLKERLGYDDTLDAFGVHGVGGTVGMLLLGIFAQKLWNPAGANGLVAGGSSFFMHQLVAVVVCIAWSCVLTFGLLKLVDALVGLRVQPDVEREGLDVNLHGEVGYAIGSTFAGHTVIEQTEQSAEPVLETT